MKNFCSNNQTYLPFSLLKYPVVTEKSWKAYRQNNQYTFLVSKNLKKPLAKLLLETIFEIKIKKIRVLISPKKLNILKRYIKRPMIKKIMITLSQNQKIKNIFD